MVDRPISTSEAAVLRRTLEVASLHPLELVLLESLKHLVVVSACACGCATVDFQSRPLQLDGKPRIVADAVGRLADGSTVGIIVWASATVFVGLEVYPLDGDIHPAGLPLPHTIAAWDATPGGT